METEKFAAQVAQINQAQEHAQEIQKTRVGGLGGSDAALILKIGLNGLGALTATDNKRLAVMCGISEQDNWGGNEYTTAGHLFEDYADRVLPLSKKYQREEYIEKKFALNFKTFAHADFTDRDEENRLHIIECKFVQDTTAHVMAKYEAQLQWYYLLGAQFVTLYHATGNPNPFEVHEAQCVTIERDQQIIDALMNGIKTLDEALSDGWKPEVIDKVAIEDTPLVVRNAFDLLRIVKAQEAELKAKKDEASAIVKQYIEDFGYSGIVQNGDIKHQVIYTRGGTKFTFDTEKFLKDHPEFDVPEYYKKTVTKSSITFK